MHSKKCLALILKSIPFQDRHWIVTALTQTEGLISFISKGNFKKNMHTNYNLCLVELVISPTKSELFRLLEFKVLDHHLFLRDSFLQIKTAQNMAKVILQTQFFQKRTSALFHFLLKCIQWIGKTEDLETFFSFFLLKVLKHEGAFHLQTTCTICQNPLKQIFVFNGECRCQKHATENTIMFMDDEIIILKRAYTLRNQGEILNLTFGKNTIEKIKQLFFQMRKDGQASFLS